MKLLFALEIIASAVAAQNLNGEPACAAPCLSSAITAGGCKLTDNACICGPGQAAIGSYAAPCLIAACTDPSDLISAASVGAAACSIYSASLAAITTTTVSTSRSSSTVSTARGQNSAALTTTSNRIQSSSSSLISSSAKSQLTTSPPNTPSSPTVNSAALSTTSPFSSDTSPSSSDTSSSSSITSSTSSAGSSPPSVTTSPSAQAHRGLSTGAKAGIGIGTALGATTILALVYLAFWYGKRSAARTKREGPRPQAELAVGTARVELGDDLTEEEKRELAGRRRAAELEGGMPVVETIGGRAELEARRGVVN